MYWYPMSLLLTHQRPVISSNRNQWNDLHSKSFDWFLHEGNIAQLWVNVWHLFIGIDKFLLINMFSFRNNNRIARSWTQNLFWYLENATLYRDHSFSVFTKFFKKLTILTTWYARVRILFFFLILNSKFWSSVERPLKKWDNLLPADLLYHHQIYL